MTKKSSSNRILCAEVLVTKYLLPLVKNTQGLLTFKGGAFYLMMVLLLFVFFQTISSILIMNIQHMMNLFLQMRIYETMQLDTSVQSLGSHTVTTVKR